MAGKCAIVTLIKREAETRSLYWMTIFGLPKKEHIVWVSGLDSYRHCKMLNWNTLIAFLQDTDAYKKKKSLAI